MKKSHFFTLGVATVATLVAPFIVAHAQTMTTDTDTISAPPPGSSTPTGYACILNPILYVWYPYTTSMNAHSVFGVSRILTPAEIATYEATTGVTFDRNEIGVIVGVWRTEYCKGNTTPVQVEPATECSVPLSKQESNGWTSLNKPVGLLHRCQ